VEALDSQSLVGESAAMSDSVFDDPPDVHDSYLLTAEHSDSVLRLLLQWRSYSKEQADLVPTLTGWLSLLDVTDVDARPARPSQRTCASVGDHPQPETRPILLAVVVPDGPPLLDAR
jgi:hypothetical protein